MPDMWNPLRKKQLAQKQIGPQENEGRYALVPRSIDHQQLRVRNRSSAKCGWSAEGTRFHISSRKEFQPQKDPLRNPPWMAAIAQRIIQIAEADVQIQEKKLEMIKGKDFDCYRYFRYLSNFTSQVTCLTLKSILDYHLPHASYALLDISAVMCKPQWTYSDFLRFLYPTSDQLSTLLLHNFKPSGAQERRPQTARQCKYDFVRFDRFMAEIVEREIAVLGMIRGMQGEIAGLVPKDARAEVIEELGMSKYVLEYDITRFTQKWFPYKRMASRGVPGMLKRMDMNQDGMVDRDDLYHFIFGQGFPGTPQPHYPQKDSLESNLQQPLSFRSTQQSSSYTIQPPQLIPSSSVPQLMQLFSNRSSYSHLPGTVAPHFTNSPKTSIHSGMVSSKSLNRLKCSPLRPQMIVQTAQTSIVNSPQTSQPINLILDTGGGQRKQPKAQNAVGSQSSKIREIQKRAKLRCFLNPPSIPEQLAPPAIKEPRKEIQDSGYEKKETQHNPFLMTQRLSLLSQHSRCLQSSQQDLSLQDTFLELLAEGGSLNNSQLRLSNLSGGMSSPELTSLRKQGSMGSTGEAAPFNIVNEDPEAIRGVVWKYHQKREDGRREAEPLRQQLAELASRGHFDVDKFFHQLSLGQDKANLSTIQGTILSNLNLSLSSRELKVLFAKDQVTVEDFFELLKPDGKSKMKLKNIQGQSLVKQIILQTVKMQMDLEMLRFEMASDLHNAYQVWLEVVPGAEYAQFVRDVTPRSYVV